MSVWILNTDLINICIWMTFMHVDYEMNYLPEMQTVELEKAGLHECIATCSICLADKKLNEQTLFKQNGSAPLPCKSGRLHSMIK